MTPVPPVVRGAWGAALLLAPRTVLTHVHHVEVDTPALVVARVLGARHLAQAVVTLVSPGRVVLTLGAYVDLAHAATDLGLAGVDRSRARGGLTDAAITTGFALAGLRAARRG